ILGDRRVVLVRLNRVVVRNPQATANAKGRFFTFHQGEPDRVVEDAVPDFQGERPVLLDAGQGHITTLQNHVQGTPTHAGGGVPDLDYEAMLHILVPVRQPRGV